MTDRQRPSGLIVPPSADVAEAPELREIASTQNGRDITRGWVDGLTRLIPQDGLLVNRGGGDYDIYRQVLSDTQVASTLQQRRLALTQTEWVVNPGGEKRADKQAAKFLEETLTRIRWDAVCAGMHYGLFYGHAVAECLWVRNGAQIQLGAVRVRDRRRFHFDGEQRLRLRTMADANGEELPERKFWSYCTGADHDDEPYGLGLAHWLYWPVLFKRSNIKFWLIAAEKFGSPTAMGVFPPSATPDEQRKLLATLQAIQTDAGLIVPEGMAVELLEAKRAGGADYAELCQYMDNAITKLVLGQLMTSEAMGGQYKADVQDSVKDDLVKADSDLICDSFNRSVVQWLCDWNFPGAAYPTVWRQTEEPEDLNQKAERYAKMFTVGYRPTLDQVEEDFGGDWELVDQPADPANNPSLLAGQGQPGGSPLPPQQDPNQNPSPPEGEGPGRGGEAPAFAEAGKPAAQAVIDTQGDQDPGWDAVMESMLAPLFKALENGLTPEQILAKMDEWYPAMNDDALVALLTKAMAAAETVGRLEAAQ